MLEGAYVRVSCLKYAVQGGIVLPYWSVGHRHSAQVNDVSPDTMPKIGALCRGKRKERKKAVMFLITQPQRGLSTAARALLSVPRHSIPAHNQSQQTHTAVQQFYST